MKFIFLSLSAISLLSSVSEAWKEDGRCWDLICAKKGKKERANQKAPDGPFQDGITCDCLSGGSRSCGGGRALTSEGDSELYMWTNNTNNEIDTFDFMHDEKLENTNQVDEQELTEFDDEDLISHMDSPNLSSGIVGGAEAQRNLEADNERKETLRQLKNDNRKRRRRRKRKNRKNDKKDKTGAPTMTNPKAPTKAPTSGPPSGGASKLALGWRPWSCWQYETKKRDWCATSRGGTSNLEIQDCDDVDDKWTFNKVDGTSYVTIRHEKQDLCWTKSGTSLLLKSCVKNSAAQEWDLDSSYKSHTNLYEEDDQAGDHLFEIQPAHSQKDCVTQNHHPKGGEKLSAQPCATSRKLGHQTNYWEKVK